MNDPGAVGAIFRCYEQGNEKEIGYLLVADVSQDSDEPDISMYEDSRIPELDRFLCVRPELGAVAPWHVNLFACQLYYSSGCSANNASPTSASQGTGSPLPI
jgi:hypothetical protein